MVDERVESATPSVDHINCGNVNQKSPRGKAGNLSTRDGHFCSFYKNVVNCSLKGKFYTVLVTASRLQYTQDVDIKLIWADVYDFLDIRVDKYTGTEGFLIA